MTLNDRTKKARNKESKPETKLSKSNLEEGEISSRIISSIREGKKNAQSITSATASNTYFVGES
jgi:hypothetical protein